MSAFVPVASGRSLWSSPVDELAQGRAARDFTLLCGALCEAQAEWVRWLGNGAHDAQQLLADIELTQTWIEEWDEGRLRRAQDGEERNVFELFQSSGELGEAAQRFADGLRRKRVLNTTEEPKPLPVKLVLMPTRKGFVEFIAYAGLHYSDARGAFWMPGMQNWSQFTLDDMTVIALEYASPGAAPGTYTEAFDMRTKSPTGMEEQVVQLALNELLMHQHGDGLPPSLVSGLSINLVTKLYGACHSRIDGDTRGKVTSKREVFVRGGQAEGGILSPNSAESRWRQDYGKHYYVPILKRAQRAGATEAEHQRIKGAKYNSFLLEREAGAMGYLTRAPLLGPGAGEVETLPNDVFGDYLEFTRSYRSAFLHWLQFNGERSKKKAAS